MRAKDEVIEWLKDNVRDNPSVVLKLHDLVTTGLIYEMDADSDDKHLPDDCVTINKLPQTVEERLINRSSSKPFTKDFWKLLRDADKKGVEKLMSFKYNYRRGYPIMPGMLHSDLFKLSDARAKIQGYRMNSLKLGADGLPDYRAGGVYAFAIEKKADDYETLEVGPQGSLGEPSIHEVDM